MITFIICIAILILGYLLYGKLIENKFGPDDRKTPAYTNQDGVDYVPMPTWRVFLVQLMDIAGTGPIFGAVSGAVFGPVVYIWIVLGCIFAGGVHDYCCGMISMRNGGANISEITGKYLGKTMQNIMRVFSVILLIMCGVVFTTGPAGLLAMLTPKALTTNFWIWTILIYYAVAVFLPIDKVIGKLYPIFGLVLIFMAVGVGGKVVFSGNYNVPELWDSLANSHPNGIPVWPFMLITVACGAISGFHATQTPIMARCCVSEKQGRKVFYGAMISEGVIALVWATAGVSCYESSQALLEAGAGCSAVIYNICSSTMGRLGCILAMIGVIVCPITSGDTAYRSARITIADWFQIDQADWHKRFMITWPILLGGGLVCYLDYSMVWRYFSWANQILASIALWAAAAYFIREKKRSLIVLLPAVFMTAVSLTYFFSAPECLGGIWNLIGINSSIYYSVSAAVGMACSIVLTFVFYRSKTVRECI